MKFKGDLSTNIFKQSCNSQEQNVKFEIIVLLHACCNINNTIKKKVILTKESNKIGPHLDRRQKDHHVNLDKLIWTYFM